MRNSARGRKSTWKIKRTTSGTLWLTGRSRGRLHVCGWIHCRSVKPTTLRPGSSNTGSSLRRASWMQTFAHIAWPRTPTFGMTSCGLPGHQWSKRWHSAWQGGMDDQATTAAQAALAANLHNFEIQLKAEVARVQVFQAAQAAWETKTRIARRTTLDTQHQATIMATNDCSGG